MGDRDSLTVGLRLGPARSWVGFIAHLLPPTPPQQRRLRRAWGNSFIGQQIEGSGGSKKEGGFRQSRGLRQCRTHLGVVNGTLRLELEHRDTAIGSAPCYLYDSGLELPAPQFLHLSIPHDCPYLSPSIALRIRRHRIGSSVQTGKRGKSKGLLL